MKKISADHVIAGSYLQSSNNLSGFDLNVFKYKVVIIGSSHKDSPDKFNTPLDEDLPGPLIIANAIHSLLQYGEIDSFSNGSRLALALFVLVIGISIAWQSRFFAPLALVVIFLSFILSFFALQKGCWFNYTFPVLMLALTVLFARIYHKFGFDKYAVMLTSKRSENQ